MLPLCFGEATKFSQDLLEADKTYETTVHLGITTNTARDHLKYIHLSESDRGTPGEGNCHWDETFTTLAAINFVGGLAMESFINMPPQVALGLSVWRPVAKSEAEVMGNGLPFLKNKARQYGLIQ